MYICAAVETFPGILFETADAIRVNYPWGSLLRAVALPDRTVLQGIARIGKPGSHFAATINVQPLRDIRRAAKLGLASAALLHDTAHFRSEYERAGLTRTEVHDGGEGGLPATSWGGHLAVSKREVWRIAATLAR